MRASTVFLLSLNWSCNKVFPAKMRGVFYRFFGVIFCFKESNTNIFVSLLQALDHPLVLSQACRALLPFIALAEDSQKTSTAPGKRRNIFQEVSASSFQNEGTGYLHTIISLLVTKAYVYTYRSRSFSTHYICSNLRFLFKTINTHHEFSRYSKQQCCKHLL